MHAGQHVFEWARQNGYTVAQMAKELGYPPHTLSQALQLNQITPRLAQLLFERFGLRVPSNATSSGEREEDIESSDPSGRRDTPYEASEPAPEAEGVAEAQSDAYRQEQEEAPLDMYRREVKRILDKSRCRDI